MDDDDDEDKAPIEQPRDVVTAKAEIEKPIVVTRKPDPKPTAAAPRGSKATSATSNHILLLVTMLITVVVAKL